MKYRLKRDLPFFAKAGCEVEFSFDDEQHPQIKLGKDLGDKPIVYFECTHKDLMGLFTDGWIEETEEVKPREFWVGIFDDSKIAYIGDEEPSPHSKYIHRYFKVREVLDDD